MLSRRSRNVAARLLVPIGLGCALVATLDARRVGGLTPQLEVGFETLTPSAGTPACAGDCNRDGLVTVDDLVNLITVGLGAPVETCEPGDVDGDRMITVDEISLAVGNALQGCVPTPPDFSTPTASRSPSPTGSFVTQTPTPTRPTPTPTPPSVPNLIVYSVTVEAVAVCIFDLSSHPKLRLCVQNVGNAAAGLFSVSIAGQDVLRSDELLRAGEFFCRTTPFVSAGSVVADSGDEVEESDEADNAAELSVVPPTPPATCTPVRTPTATVTERRFTCCQRESDCYGPEPVGICFSGGTGYESSAFCNAETGQCENIPPTRTPTPTPDPTQPPADLVPVSVDLYAPLLGCDQGTPIGGVYCVTNRGGDVSTSFVLRLVTGGTDLDFASFAGIRGGEELCLVGPYEGLARFVVDPYDTIAESDETNNSLAFSLPRPTFPPPCTPTPTPLATPTA